MRGPHRTQQSKGHWADRQATGYASVTTCLAASAYTSSDLEGTFARRAQHPNECSGHLSQCFTPKHHPSSDPGTLSTSTLYDCWEANNFPFFPPTNGTITCTPSWPPTSKSKNLPLVRDGPLKWPHRRVGVLDPNSRGHTKAWENFARRARRVPGALTYSP